VIKGDISNFKSYINKRITVNSILYSVYVVILFFCIANKTTLDVRDVLIAITVLIAAGALILDANVRLSINEGLGHVAASSIIRLIGYISASAVLWLTLVKYADVKSIFISQIVGALILNITSRIFCKRFFLEEQKSIVGASVKLSQWQLQNAMVGFGSYIVLILPMYTLIALDQLEIAGKYGFTLQIFGAITGFAITIVNSRANIYCRLYAQGHGDRITEMHSSLSNRSWLIFFTLFSVLFVIKYIDVEILYIIKNKILDDVHLLVWMIPVAGIHLYNLESVLSQAKGGDRMYSIAAIRVLLLVACEMVFYWFSPIEWFIEFAYLATVIILLSIRKKFQ